MTPFMPTASKRHWGVESEVADNTRVSAGGNPGAKNAEKAKQNAGALGWEMSEEEAAALDEATRGWR